MLFSLGACTGNGSGKIADEEEILNNFFANANENNYSIETLIFTAEVYSKDLVRISFDGGFDDYFMTLNGNELYYASLDEGQPLDDHSINFLGKGTAVEYSDVQNRLINSWKYYLTGNIWDTFTNDPDNPLRYVIHLESLGAHIMEYVATIPGAYKDFVSDIELILKDKKASAATIQVNFVKEREGQEINIDPVVVNIDFGIERKELGVDSWLNDENRYYAPAQDDWTEANEMTFLGVYNQYVTEKFDEAIPFPKEFATRTFHVYGTEYGQAQRFFATDTLATKEGYDSYCDKLVKDYGFEKHEEMIEGEPISRFDKMLYSFNEIYFAYSSIYLEYTDEGVNMEAKLTYNDIKYQGRDTINELIKKMHFPELPRADYLTTFIATDDTLEQCEGSWFATTYAQSYQVKIDHTNASQAEEYLDNYYDLLVAEGFSRSTSEFISKDEGEQYSARLDSAVIGDKVYIEFWLVNYMDDDEVVGWMDKYDFPEIDVKNMDSLAKDATRYYIYDSHVYQKDILSLAITFSSVDERNDYMRSFVLKLLNEEGFVEYENLKLKVARRDTTFYNAEKGLIIAYNDTMTLNIVNFHLIKAADDFEPLE